MHFLRATTEPYFHDYSNAKFGDMILALVPRVPLEKQLSHWYFLHNSHYCFPMTNPQTDTSRSRPHNVYSLKSNNSDLSHEVLFHISTYSPG
jgi:hypothetical protein